MLEWDKIAFASHFMRRYPTYASNAPQSRWHLYQRIVWSMNRATQAFWFDLAQRSAS